MIQTLEGKEGLGKGRINPDRDVVAREEAGVDVKHEFFTASSAGEGGEPCRAQAEG